MIEEKSSFLFLAIISTALCQELPVGYNIRSKAAAYDAWGMPNNAEFEGKHKARHPFTD